ncbi:hypothetical protein [Flavisphingomonas formosensis]|uniref:hypothetical protein n=1 Tax=Flavisphingomonas formosensis TaxID=861534 RepID=UPI0012F91A1E|nr:hypothetical protein [Sphingomonas formosensis]
MDINYLLARQQISLMNAAVAQNMCARRAHTDLAAAYGAALSSLGFPVTRNAAGQPGIHKPGKIADLAIAAGGMAR